MPAPTSGKSAPPRATSAASRSTKRPTGTRVKNATAAASPRTSAAGIGDSGVVEGRHLLEDRERRPQERQRKRRTGPLPQPKLEIEQRLEPERIEQERVPRLG